MLCRQLVIRNSISKYLNHIFQHWLFLNDYLLLCFHGKDFDINSFSNIRYWPANKSCTIFANCQVHITSADWEIADIV